MKTWTAPQLKKLKKEYALHEDLRALATELDKTYLGLKSKALILGLKRKRTKRKFWTKEELKAFKKIYPFTTMAVLMKKFKCQNLSIYRAANLTGVKKTQEFKDKYCKPPAGSGAAFRFPAGHVPMNKGKKQKDYMSKEQIEKTKATRFKKGQLPPNTLHYGCITIRFDKNMKTGKSRAYAWIRLQQAKWEMYHVWLYRKYYGEIPEGKIIVFKDVDSLNFDIDNLMAITRQEHIDRCRLGDGFIASQLSRKKGQRGMIIDTELRKKILTQKDLIEIKRLQIIINRKIKSHEQQGK